MKRIVASFAITCSLALTGCDVMTQMGQVIGVVGTDWRPPTTTGYLKGRILDRSGVPLVGAKVSNGAAVYYSAKASKSVTVLTGASATATQSVPIDADGQFVLNAIPTPYTFITAEFDGQVSAPIQIPIKSKTLNQAGDIKIPVDGPVGETASQSLRFLGTTTPGNTVTYSQATGSTTPVYRPSDTVSMLLQAPPGGAGTTVKFYRLTYFAIGANTNETGYLTTTDVGGSNPSTISLSFPATVLPGSTIRSGEKAQADVVISNTSTAFSNYLRLRGALVAKVELFDKNDVLIKDRDGSPISTTIKIQYQPI